MKFEKTTVDVLKHFSKFAQAIIIRPNEPLYVSSPDRSIAARAVLPDQTFDGEIRAFDLSYLSNVLSMFVDGEHDVKVGQKQLEIVAKRQKQLFRFADESVLEVPTPSKMEKFFASPAIDFDLSADDFKQITKALQVNGTNTIVFRSEGGKLKIVLANVGTDGNVEATTNQYEIDTDVNVDREVNAGIGASNFLLTPGAYRVGIAQGYIRFIGSTVSYVMPVQAWSK